MKIEAAVNELTLSGVASTGEFKIRNSAKAFSILSSGLYSNKIKAIIRELSCNAVDSHVAAGKADTPFEVHLPSAIEPWFSVRDFGTGLDDNQVTNIYTTYFESTKTDSNDFIGALGLGSKSPFSYTENFTVTAVKSGVKCIYSAFINEMGVPSIAQMSKELTDEGNGVEVKFSVTERYDYDSFRFEAQNVFQWFKHKPIVTGNHSYHHSDILYKEENIVPGIHTSDSVRGAMAVMGNIAYPLNKISEPEKHFGDLAGLLRCGLVIEFPIGDLDFAASREELSFIPVTINSIKRRLDELNKNLLIHFSEKADKFDSEWARATFLYNESRSDLYKGAIAEYVRTTNFPLYDDKAYYGRKVFDLKVSELASKGISISGFNVVNRLVRNKITNTSRYVNATTENYMDIPVDNNVVIVLNDLKTGCDSRARYHFTRDLDQKIVYCVNHSSTDLAVRQIAYDELLKELHNPPTVIKASTLIKRQSVKPTGTSTTGILKLVPKKYHSAWNRQASEYKWDTYTEALSPTEKYYYVCLDGYAPKDLDGKSFNVHELRNMLDSSGISALSDITILGVRKTRIKEISKLKNWIWVGDKVKKEIAKIPASRVRGLIARNLFDNYATKPYTKMSVVAGISPTSDYAKFALGFDTVESYTDIPSLVKLCGQYGKTLAVDKIESDIKSARALVIAKYPLIGHATSADTKDIIDYINLIDNAPTIQI